MDSDDQSMLESINARAAELNAAASTDKPDAAPAVIDKGFVLDRLRRNRIGDADLFCALFRGKYIYVEEWGRWLFWDKHHWALDMREKRALADVERVCAAYQNAFAESGEDEGSPLHKIIKPRMDKLRTAAGRKEVLECAVSIDDPPTISVEQLDQQPYLMATPTGVVDLRTGECRPGEPLQYLLNNCPTPWTGLDTDCPSFRQYLLTCMDDDQEMADFIVRLLGYGLLGEKNLHIWAIMYGPLSRNGKDTLMNTIKRILGKKLHVRIGVNLLVEQKFPKDSGKPEPEMLALRGAKLAYASEANARQTLDQAKIKDLTGGGFITARGISDKYMTEWKQSALLLLLTNYLPKLDTDDDGFNARTLCIEWPCKFVPAPKKPYERQIDYEMSRKLEAEDSGILACLAGRGLPLEAVERYGLGYIEGEDNQTGTCIFRPRSAFGLPEKTRANGTASRVFRIPRGVTIPCWDNATPRQALRVRIRRRNVDLNPEDRKDRKFLIIPQAEHPYSAPLCLPPLNTAPALATWVVVEAELDAMAVHHACAGRVGAMSVLTVAGKPDKAGHAALAAAARILVCIDFDTNDKGKHHTAENWKWWKERYPQAKLWPVPQGKDPGEAFEKGVDLARWVRLGMPGYGADGTAAGSGAAPQTPGQTLGASRGEACAVEGKGETPSTLLPPLPSYMPLTDIPADVLELAQLWQNVPVTYRRFRDADGHCNGFEWDVERSWRHQHPHQPQAHDHLPWLVRFCVPSQ